MSIKSLIPLTLRYRVADARGRGPYSSQHNLLRCVFIHIPKCAGTSIATTLNLPVSHIPAETFLAYNPRKFNSYFKFTVIRNPWDRVHSAFCYLKKGGGNRRDETWAREHIPHGMDFHTFVNEKLPLTSTLTWDHFRPQLSYISVRSEKMPLDYVGRYENLATDFRDIAKQLDHTPSDLPHANKTLGRNHYHHAYTQKTRAIVATVYSEDIREFRYSFDSQ